MKELFKKRPKEKKQYELEGLKIREPNTIIECSLFTKAIMNPLNIYFTLIDEGENFNSNALSEAEKVVKREENKQIMLGVFTFIYQFEKEELDVIFTHILDDDGASLGLKEKKPNISLDIYFIAMQLFVDFLYDLKLPNLFKKEIGYLSFEKIDKAMDRIIGWKKEELGNINSFISEALKEYTSGR